MSEDIKNVDGGEQVNGEQAPEQGEKLKEVWRALPSEGGLQLWVKDNRGWRNKRGDFSHLGIERNGRTSGSNNGMSKLSNEEVLKAVELYKSGKSCRQIGSILGVYWSIVSSIIKGNTYRNVTNGLILYQRSRRASSEFSARVTRKLTDDQASLVRKFCVQGRSFEDVASVFGVSGITVSGIAYGLTYKHVTYSDAPMARKGAGSNTRKLNEEIVLIIRKRYSDGESVSSLAKEYGVSTNNIRALVNRKTWKDI